MRIRRRMLPPGWYPGTAAEVRQAIEAWTREPDGPPGRAGVAPHAGWEFSGSVACRVFAALERDIDTILIIGGHLGPADGFLCAAEEGYETPLGAVTADLELAERLRRDVELADDRWADNTVEVQLCFVRHFLPNARCLGLRAAPTVQAADLGRAIAEAARELGRRAAVVGSTDLTHYGPGYDFTPAGQGEKAARWVREVNDRRFIEALLAMDAAKAARLAREERSACSAGGAIAAMSFAAASGARKGVLLEHRTSLDVHPSDSFVGYAAILYPQAQ